MDAGAAVVIFISGLCAKKTRDDEMHSKSYNILHELIRSLKSSLVIFLMGSIRVILHYYVGYHVNI